jgi:hypothetical protein
MIPQKVFIRIIPRAKLKPKVKAGSMHRVPHIQQKAHQMSKMKHRISFIPKRNQLNIYILREYSNKKGVYPKFLHQNNANKKKNKA